MSATQGLLKAIEGWTGENSGNKEHESNVALLQRVAGEISKGKGGDKISPGQFEAQHAAQKNMPSEEGHDGGKGSVKTNEPGSFRGNEKAADPQSASKGPLSGAGPVPSDGHLTSAKAGPSAPSGIVEMRRMAAAKGLEAGMTSGGNRRSNPEQPFPPASKRIGDVKAPVKEGKIGNAGPVDDGKVPIGGKDSLSGDGWGKAAAKARKMAPTR